MNKEKWIQCALEKGMEGFEIYQSFQTEKEFSWYEGDLDSFVTSKFLGTSIRGLYNGKMANMALESVKDEEMDSIIEQLILQAKIITMKEDDALRFPEPIEYIDRVTNIVYPSIEEIKEFLSVLEKEILAYDQRVSQVSSLSYSYQKDKRSIYNSLGINVEEADQGQFLVAAVVVQEGEEVRDASHVLVIDSLAQIDREEFVKTLCDKALGKLHASSLKTQNCPVIFERGAMTSLFSAFTGLYKGDLIYKELSPIKDKLDQQIYSEKITVIDNPRNKDSLNQLSFDDEGCPTREKKVVENGIFKTPLMDTKSALCLKRESTGNGFKPGYAGKVGVSAMNMYIAPGEASLEDLWKHMNTGLMITSLSGLHAGIDFASTNFSLQAQGYWIENGKKDHYVTLITVAGNFLELMNKVVEIGNDLDWSYRSMACPSIYFEDCSIGGE
ncbi:MAG: TldD/PmbA family protein [Firmicutes bacterium]|nr:TldD/PmbA family protein [Bacillota bacterium]